MVFSGKRNPPAQAIALLQQAFDIAHGLLRDGSYHPTAQDIAILRELAATMEERRGRLLHIIAVLEKRRQAQEGKLP